MKNESRSRECREGRLGRRRNYNCRGCGEKFQHDGFQLPEDQRYCEECRSWIRSDCPICGRGFPHHSDYEPVTCGKFDCLQEANKRGLLVGVGK